jgi:hypothetical protein
MKKRRNIATRPESRHRSAAAALTGQGALKVDAVIQKTVRDDKREVWRVSANGQIKNITTTASSAAAMDEAIEIYGRVLERLANR